MYKINYNILYNIYLHAINVSYNINILITDYIHMVRYVYLITHHKRYYLSHVLILNIWLLPHCSELWQTSLHTLTWPPTSKKSIPTRKLHSCYKCLRPSGTLKLCQESIIFFFFITNHSWVRFKTFDYFGNRNFFRKK